MTVRTRSEMLFWKVCGFQFLIIYSPFMRLILMNLILIYFVFFIGSTSVSNVLLLTYHCYCFLWCSGACDLSGFYKFIWRIFALLSGYGFLIMREGNSDYSCEFVFFCALSYRHYSFLQFVFCPYYTRPLTDLSYTWLAVDCYKSISKLTRKLTIKSPSSKDLTAEVNV